MDKETRLAIAIITISVSMWAFFAVIDTSLPAVARFALAAGLLVCCGVGLMRLYKIEGWWGIMLVRSQFGLKWLDEVAKKYPAFWGFFADMGLVIGYGALAYFLMAKQSREPKRLFALFLMGELLLLAISGIVAPYASAALFSQLTGGAEFAVAGSKLSADVMQAGYTRYIFLAVLLLGGLASMATLNIVIYAGVILTGVAEYALGTSVRILTATPGGVPLIPGKNIPLIEGIAALAVVLAVHEALHGIVARLHKLPLKSAGLVFFGFLPFGAFVDIDEKKLMKEKKEVQNSVFVAGTAANFATSIIFLCLLFAFIFATESFRTSGVFVHSGTLPAGAQIFSINGTSITTLANTSLLPNSSYSFETSAGTFVRPTDANGRIGIQYVVADKSGAHGQLRYSKGYSFMSLILGFLSLTFALNFVVGVINLIPLPLFDGYHIMKNGVGNARIATAIAWIVAIAFVATMLPWLLR